MPLTDFPSRRVALLLALIGALGGCDTLPGAGRAAVTTAPAPAASAPEPPASAPLPETPPAPATPVMREQAQRIAVATMELLDAGREDQARDELSRALALDPSNRLAQKLLRETTVDPIAELGRESFAYRVQANDSLSKIAGRFLGDVQAFYLLARYNDIKVPRQVEEGQLIRVPGKAPATLYATPAPAPAPAQAAAPAPAAMPATPPAPPSPPPETPAQSATRKAQAAEKAGDLATAYEQYKVAASADQPGASTKVAELGKRLVSKYSTEARLLYTNKDLPGAIRTWDKVLAIEPGNPSARLERARAADLYQKYQQIH